MTKIKNNLEKFYQKHAFVIGVFSGALAVMVGILLAEM